MTVDTQLLESEAMRFELLKAVAKDGAAARLGRLAAAGRTPIDTPNFIAMTSRGTLPHITPENVSRHLQVTGTYMALEDCECDSRMLEFVHETNSTQSSSVPSKT